MFKRAHLLLAFTAVFLPLSQSIPAADRMQLFKKGDDGDTVIYQLYCPSAYRTTVSLHFREDPVKVCTYPHNSYGKETCRTPWTVDEAASWACKSSR